MITHTLRLKSALKKKKKTGKVEMMVIGSSLKRVFSSPQPFDCWLFCFLFFARSLAPIPLRRVNALNGSSTRDQPLIQSHENSSFFVFFCLGAHKRKRIRVFETMQGNARQGSKRVDYL
jgi:hypothetical protein